MIGFDPADLTVVIPHLDTPEALDLCLASLADERCRLRSEFPVIVVDNGSSQRPEQVCTAYHFVRLIEETEPGPGPARNSGARMATTEIIAFIDADCTACPGWAVTFLDHFRKHPETSVVGGEVRIAHADPDRPTAIEAYESVYGYRMRQYYERDGYTGTGNMAVRREAFDLVGGFAGISVAEDLDWGRRARSLGLRIEFLPEMTIATPARGSYSELARKWDRHIGHQFEDCRTFADRLRWVLKALALAVSPIIEVPTILRSDRLFNAQERWMAFAVLARIRLYRSWRMLSLMVGAGPSSKAAWRER